MSECAIRDTERPYTNWMNGGRGKKGEWGGVGGYTEAGWETTSHHCHFDALHTWLHCHGRPRTNPRFHARPIWAANLCCYAEGKSGAQRRAWNHVVRCTAASPAAAAAAVCHTEIAPLSARHGDAHHFRLLCTSGGISAGPNPSPFTERQNGGERKVFNGQSGAEPWPGREPWKVFPREPLSQWNVYSRATHGSKMLTRSYSSVYSPGRRLLCCHVAKAITGFILFYFFFNFWSSWSFVMQYGMVEVVMKL